MKLSKKKILAREFLILLSCTMFFVLAFFGTYPYNAIIESKIDQLQKSIESLTDKIDCLTVNVSSKEEKQKWFFNENIDRYRPDIGYATYTDLWNRLEKIQKADSIIYKWDNVWSSELIKVIKDIGFKNGKEFNQFVKDNLLSFSELNEKAKADSIASKIVTIQSKIRTEQYKMLDYDDRIQFALICLAIIGIIAFPIRYLFYSIKWSIKTLREKE